MWERGSATLRRTRTNQDEPSWAGERSRRMIFRSHLEIRLGRPRCICPGAKLPAGGGASVQGAPSLCTTLSRTKFSVIKRVLWYYQRSRFCPVVSFNSVPGRRSSYRVEPVHVLRIIGTPRRWRLQRPFSFLVLSALEVGIDHVILCMEFVPRRVVLLR